MAEIIIYTTNYCPYCVKAKNFLNNRNLPFKEIDVTNNPEMREKLVEMSGGRKTVPQIFINGKSIGGFTDMEELSKSAAFDTLLSSK